MVEQSPPVPSDNSLQDMARNSLQGKLAQTHYVVRLPIFDPMSNVEAYELLFWGWAGADRWLEEFAGHPRCV